MGIWRGRRTRRDAGAGGILNALVFVKESRRHYRRGCVVAMNIAQPWPVSDGGSI